MSSKRNNSFYTNQSTTKYYPCSNNGDGNIHQSHHRNGSNYNHHYQRNNNFNNRRRNHHYHSNQQYTAQQSVNHNGNNHDFLNSDQIFNWFNSQSVSAKFMIPDPATYAFITQMASIRYNWIREDHTRKLWKVYLKLGEEYDHWPEEVLQSTKSLDSDINIEFIEEKIREFDDNIDFIVNDYMACSISFENDCQRDSNEQMTKASFQSYLLSSVATPFPKNHNNDYLSELDTYARNYTMKCTQDFRKLINNKIKLAKRQAEDL